MRRCLGVAALLCLAMTAPAGAACRLALALALDVSGSVDEREYVLQTTGIAEALNDTDVRAALLALPEVPVTLAIYEWSSSSYQRQILPWTALRGEADIDAIRTRLLRWQRAPAPEATGLGTALEHGVRMMEGAPACWDRTLDVSADGKNNDWPLPERLRAAGRLGTVRINALVVTSATADQRGAGELADYFRARIIHGTDAFVEVAQGYDDYADAMRRKLLREIATLPMGALPRPSGGHRLASNP